MMDSNDLRRSAGITIFLEERLLPYKGAKFNIGRPPATPTSAARWRNP